MKIDENIIIRCKSQTEVSKCLDMLKDLEFETFYEENDYELFVAATFITPKLGYLFTSFKTIEISSKNNFVSFKTFQKLYNKQIEEKKEPDLVVDKNGKILKINNTNKEYHVFFYDNNLDKNNKITYFPGSFLAQDINKIDFYTSLKALEKALKRKEIENKLRLLAFELNGNREIDWDNDKFKYYLDYSTVDKTIIQDSWKTIKHQGSIYCYSEDFLQKATELISETDLKEYLINC